MDTSGTNTGDTDNTPVYASYWDGGCRGAVPYPYEEPAPAAKVEDLSSVLT